MRLQDRPLPADTILNVNVPAVPFSDIQGFQATRLGLRHRSEPAVPAHDPKGRRVYWVGAAGAGQDAGPVLIMPDQPVPPGTALR